MIEEKISLQLNPCSSEISGDLGLSSSEVMEELKSLKETVSLMEKKIEKMETLFPEKNMLKMSSIEMETLEKMKDKMLHFIINIDGFN